MTRKFTTVLEAIKEQTSQIHAVATRVEEAEMRILDVEETTVASEAKIAALEAQVRDLIEHVDDLDNRGRRCNVSIIGLPENTEGTDPVTFLETWIPEYLQMKVKGNRVKIDRAHRVMARANSKNKGKDGKEGSNRCSRPRPLIIKLYNFRAKQRIMAAARKLGSRDSESASTEPKISFFNDFSAGVVRRRKAFEGVKARLRKMKVEYALLYPATLRVTLGDSVKNFTSPRDAELLAQSLEEGRGDPTQSTESEEGDKLDNV